MIKFAVLGAINLIFYMKNKKKAVHSTFKEYELAFLRGEVFVELKGFRTPQQVLKYLEAEKFVHKDRISQIVIKGPGDEKYSEEAFLEVSTKNKAKLSLKL